MPIDLVDVGCHKSWFKKKKKEVSERREAQILHFKVLFRMLIKMKECPNMVIR